MVASTVTNDTSAESSWSQLLGARQTRAWHDQEGVTPTFRKGHWKKKQIWRSKFRMQKKIFLMQFLIFFCYELIVCPLIFKSNKVYFASSLIAKPILQGVTVYSGKSLSSKFGRNQCLYRNKRYTSRKPLISALIWHPESGRGIIRRVPRLFGAKNIFCCFFTGAWTFFDLLASMTSLGDNF